MKHPAESDDGAKSERRSVNKSKSTKAFKRQVGKTKALNVVQAPMRGGWRL